MNEITEKILNAGEAEYKDFTAKLTPNIEKESIIGVRVPILRKIASEYKNSEIKEDFINTLPHKYYEENLIHSIFLCGEKDFNKLIKNLTAFLPYVNSWAVCDTLRPKVFSKNKQEALPYILKWVKSDKPYTIRFGVDMLMTYYLEEDFKPEYHTLVAGIKNDDYYVKMMVAWYFATALHFRYDETIPFLEMRLLSPWVHKKAISKAIESYRITESQKEYLKKLR